MDNQFIQLTVAIEGAKQEIVKAVNEISAKTGLPTPMIILILQGIISDTKAAEYEMAFSQTTTLEVTDEEAVENPEEPTN